MTEQISLSRYLSNLRKVPLEVFECRHCEIETQSSDEYEIATQLCKKCFDARAKYRRSSPVDIEGKAELHWSSNRHGEKRSGRKLICANCSEQYAIVPLSFQDPSDTDIAEWRAHFNKMAPFREQSGNADAKFKYESFDYTNAPKGWTNEILCKNCFDKITDAYSLGIDEKKEVISQIAAAAKPQSAIQAAPEKAEQNENLAQITKENPIGAIVTVIAIAASILALWKFVFVGISDGWSEASNESPYGKILFYVICVFMYLYAISVLHKIGGICREISTVLSWIAGIVLVAIVASHFPSCNSTSHMPDDSPYYRK